MKTSTLRIICIILGIIIIAMATVAFMRIEKIKHESADLRNYVKQLEVNLNIKNIQVKDLQEDNIGLNQELEQVKISYYSDQLLLKELKRRYLVTKSYAEVAESLLLANDIEFRQVD